MSVTVELELSFETFAALREAAHAAGRSPEALAADLLTEAIQRLPSAGAEETPGPPNSGTIPDAVNMVCQAELSRLELMVLDAGVPLIVAVSGAVDAYTAPEMRSHLLAAMDDFGRNVFILDMSGCNYMDSRGLGVFIGLAKTARERGGMIVFAELPKRVRRLFEVTQLDRTFHLTDSTEAAVALIEDSPVEVG
jgi:anti-sigma B factor antagonist